MDTPIDALQIKIERAKDNLPEETRRAIDAVDWRAFILSLREKKGFSFEQLEDLELDTELLLCGLLPLEKYSKELEENLKIPKSQVDLLVSEMNEVVFKKIREELIKNTERKELFAKKNEGIGGKIYEPVIKTDINIDIPQKPQIKTDVKMPERKMEEKPDETIHFQKLAGSFKIPTTKTEYSLNNIPKVSNSAVNPFSEKTKTSKIDPYRVDPSE